MDTISWRRGKRVIAKSAEQHPDFARVSDALESSTKAFLAKIVLLSLLAHICLILALVRLDLLSYPASGSREIPVPVVVAEPAPQSRAAVRMEAPVKERAPQETAAAAQNGTNTHRTANEGEGARERSPMRSTAVVPFDAAPPHHFRSFAVPNTAADGSETINYQFVVGGMLERVKQYPDSAVRRGAKGTATIGFVLDESGGVVSVSLLRSSGEVDLDSESVALVRRAAPFPPPPSGAKRSFAIEVAFGNRK